jgi:hypothetical protein
MFSATTTGPDTLRMRLHSRSAAQHHTGAIRKAWPVGQITERRCTESCREAGLSMWMMQQRHRRSAHMPCGSRSMSAW